MELLVLFLALAGLWLLVAPAWAIVANRRLRGEVDALRAEVAQLRNGPAAPQPAASPTAVATAEGIEAVAPEGAAPVDDPERAPAPTAAPRARESLEQRLAQRWLVWLGGGALALGGAFILRSAVEQGWFGPVARLLLALLLGCGLIATGERLRRRGTAGYAPPALAAAGVCTLFATIWAGHTLYGLFPSAIAFPSLAAVTALAILLAWSHGPLLAALGIGGAFAVPALVDSADPSAWALFAYLLLPVAASLLVLRYRPWTWLGWLGLGGAATWLALGLLAPWRATGPSVAFALVVAALYLFVPAWATGGRLARIGLARVVAVAVPTAAAFLLSLHVSGRPEAGESLGLLLLAALAMAASLVARVPLAAATAPAAATMIALLLWNLEPWQVGLELAGDPTIALPPLRLLPEQASGFVGWAAAFAILHAAFGLVVGRRRRCRPFLWLSAGVPVVALAILYLRLSDLTPSLPWASVALVLAALELTAASRVHRIGGGREPLAAYAAGTVAGLALACAFALREAWLTVALAAMLPALGLIWRRLDVPGLRTTALALATIVAARVVLDPEAGRLTDGAAPTLGWILHGLGLPLLAFLAAGRLFTRDRDDRLAQMLATGALLLWLALGWALVRLVMDWTGDPAMASGLAEWSLHGLVWLTTGLGLLRRHRISPWAPTLAAAAVLCVSALLVLLAGLLDINPLATGAPVGRLPILNILLFAYALPVPLLALLARELSILGQARLAAVVAALAIGLGLLWLGLELRHAFHGTILTGPTGPGESWAYTALLLLYAAALMAAGILRASRPLRLASLAILVLAAGKAFLVDMASIDGLWRAASFLVVGGCLVGIGLAYQRFVFQRRDEAAP
ncbi:MAG TPA: DUF2339 domain-containing protein [Geminicoccaceae bacterium]|nr:DUF2339 domain-containing protein [Geminicoccus sp.]HMU48805.1 DUF2339 domain-containing protein [Geminicoccaceae bacterium]